jgi:hypothetical protein
MTLLVQFHSLPGNSAVSSSPRNRAITHREMVDHEAGNIAPFDLLGMPSFDPFTLKVAALFASRDGHSSQPWPSPTPMLSIEPIQGAAIAHAPTARPHDKADEPEKSSPTA